MHKEYPNSYCLGARKSFLECNTTFLIYKKIIHFDKRFHGCFCKSFFFFQSKSTQKLPFVATILVIWLITFHTRQHKVHQSLFVMMKYFRLNKHHFIYPYEKVFFDGAALLHRTKKEIKVNTYKFKTFWHWVVEEGIRSRAGQPKSLYYSVDSRAYRYILNSH